MELILALAVVAVTLSRTEEIFSCFFDEEEDLQLGNDYGSGMQSKDHFKWKDNTVPYYFDTGVIVEDRKMFREQMDIIEANTCIRFQETELQLAPFHRLRIETRGKSCIKSEFNGRIEFEFAGRVGSIEISTKREVYLQIDHQLRNDPRCFLNGVNLFTGGVLHELMHALGAIHTQRRVDRDQYIIYNKQCVQPDHLYQSQYEKHKKNHVNFTVPYRCDSIMHYKNTTFQIDEGCPTMSPRPGNTNCNQFGSNVPREEDWYMLNRYHNCSQINDNQCEYKDKVKECPDWKHLCNRNDVVKHLCQATCNCEETITRQCEYKDKHICNCSEWKHFCKYDWFQY